MAAIHSSVVVRFTDVFLARSVAARSTSRAQLIHQITPRYVVLRAKPQALRSPWRTYSQKGPSHVRPNPTPNLNSPEPHSLTARLKKLSREYGWTVIGVYLALTVADFPFCFLAVKYIGAERVAHAEHVIVGGAKRVAQKVFPNLLQEKVEVKEEVEAAEAAEDAVDADGSHPSECATCQYILR